MSAIVLIIWLISGCINAYFCSKDDSDTDFWRLEYWITYTVLMTLLFYHVIFVG